MNIESLKSLLNVAEEYIDYKASHDETWGDSEPDPELDAIEAKVKQASNAIKDLERGLSIVRGAIIGALATGHMDGRDGANYSRNVLHQIATALELDIPESVKPKDWR